MSYVDLVGNPWATVRAIYEHFGWPLEPAAVAAMEAWQERQAARRRHEVRHSYDLADFELTPEAVDAAFSATASSFTPATSASRSGLQTRPTPLTSRRRRTRWRR